MPPLCAFAGKIFMSGIAGIVNLDGAPLDRELLSRMTDYLAFRGPDAAEIWVHNNAGLGHTLLRTTTEAATEKQPLTLDGNVWLTADARIDARDELIEKLKRKSQPLAKSPNDAELILHAYTAWGDACVDHLLGDFAFAIWDSRSQRLFCARDQFGVKPFFFTRVADSFLFSNTLNALRLDDRVSDELNEIAVGDYLLFGLNQNLSTTIFRDVQRLPPGQCLTIANGSITTRRYWSPAISKPIRFQKPQDYVERFSELLTQSVADRLRTDRAGISMSGGLDSTSLAVIARDLLNGEVHSYSVVYDSLIPDEERRYSTAAADHLAIPITHVNAAEYSLFDEQQPGDMKQPEPFLLSPFTAQFNNLLRLCASFGRVALTGYDGDSLMNEPAGSYFASALKDLRVAEFVTNLSWYVSTQKSLPPLGLKTRIKGLRVKPRRENFFPDWIDESFAKRTHLAARVQQSETNSPHKLRPAAFDALNSKVWAPLFEGYDPGATRLHLEMRHPFCDLRLVEFLLAIPAVPWCVHKHILRTAMQNRLPSTILNRRKTPLSGDPALQLARHASVRWLDSFEVNPQLSAFVNLNLRRPLADEQTPDALWANLRVFALNYWLTNSQPIERRIKVDKQHYSKTSIA